MPPPNAKNEENANATETSNSHKGAGSLDNPGNADTKNEKVASNACPDAKVEQIVETISSLSSEDTRTPRQKYVSKLQFMALCWTLVLGGWNDGSTGALLPRIQIVYGLKYIILSMVFVFSCLGFMAGSVLNLYVTPRLGFGKTLVGGSVIQIIAYCLQAGAPPYPVLVLGYFMSGMGISLQDAQANGFIASLKYDAAYKMGIIHSCYGVGLLLAPFVSTQFAQLPRWSFHFLVSLGLAISNLVFQFTVFRFGSLNDSLEVGGEPPVQAAPAGEGNLFRQVMHSWPTQMLAVFIIVHLGVGVTLSGWIVTYIVDIRGGGSSSGYISAGVAGGTVIGRFALFRVNQLIGEKNAILVYSMFCIGLEIIVWRVHSLIGNAVAASIIGIFLGPMYPIAMNQATRILPPYMLTGAIGWIAGFGQTGSALMPFITGAVASKAGLEVMPPILAGTTAVMMIVWAFVPNTPYNASN